MFPRQTDKNGMLHHEEHLLAELATSPHTTGQTSNGLLD
jgi:hypothetical protein